METSRISNETPNATALVTAGAVAAPSTTLLAVAGVVILTIAGFFIVPPLLRKCSNKLYKRSVKKDEIDIDSLGPEIVKKDDKETER